MSPAVSAQRRLSEEGRTQETRTHDLPPRTPQLSSRATTVRIAQSQSCRFSHTGLQIVAPPATAASAPGILRKSSTHARTTCAHAAGGGASAAAAPPGRAAARPCSCAAPNGDAHGTRSDGTRSGGGDGAARTGGPWV